MQTVHHLELTVYYEDTDAAGIVYYANYLRFAERARSDWLKKLGFPVQDLVPRFGGLFVVHRCDIRFIRPARLGDELNVSVAIKEIQAARLAMMQQIMKADAAVAELMIDLVFVGDNGKPRRLPSEIRRTLGL